MYSLRIIRAKDLTKFYGQTVGVNEISFEVDKGELFGFLGPNGAGKTTTIRLLLDLLRPTSGLIKIFGENIKTNSLEIRKRIGYLPGEFSAYHHLTGYEFLRLLSKLRNDSFDPGLELFDRFELSQKDLYKKIKELSHGTLQKLGIIQSLMHQPELLILDEPTTGLDPLMKEVFYELMLEKQQNGTTVFFSSHNLDEVEKLCERVAIIRKGEIVGLEYVSTLKAKAGQNIEIQLKEPMEKLELPNATLIDNNENTYRFRVTGKWPPVLKKLSELPVAEISITRPDLEDLFMDYYREKTQQ
ncbi:MAG: ABC transporter ATP-binding protein [Bacteroidales bacterium]|nr:ABC transporter ATP-binding protein [Bacteroidales bacterium]